MECIGTFLVATVAIPDCGGFDGQPMSIDAGADFHPAPQGDICCLPGLATLSYQFPELHRIQAVICFIDGVQPFFERCMTFMLADRELPDTVVDCVRIGNEEALIPDLDNIQTMVERAWAAARK